MADTDLPERLTQLRHNMNTAIDHRVAQAVAAALSDIDRIVEERVQAALEGGGNAGQG